MERGVCGRQRIVLECQRTSATGTGNCETNQKFNIYNDDGALLGADGTLMNGIKQFLMKQLLETAARLHLNN